MKKNSHLQIFQKNVPHYESIWTCAFICFLKSVNLCAYLGLGVNLFFEKCQPYAYIIAKFFQGGYRTKMKIRSENFSRASGAQKKGFPNFSPAAGFFRRGGTENR